MFVTGLQSLTEGRSIYDVLSLYLSQDMKWDWSQVNRFVGFNGLGLVAGGIGSAKMMKSFGMRKFTTLSNLCIGVAFLAWSQAPPFNALSSFNSLYIGGAISFVGSRKRDCVESLIYSIGTEKGYGKGFMSGSINNFRAIVNILGPLIFGGTYAAGAERGFAALPFLIAAVSAFIAEIPHRMLTNEDLRVDKDGQPIEDSKSVK